MTWPTKKAISHWLQHDWPYYVVFVLITPVFFFNLSNTPINLIGDEAGTAVDAHTLATSLHDRSGNLLPLYVWHLNTYWTPPVTPYFTAIFLKFLPLTETSIRIPNAIVGLTTIALIMMLAQMLFKNKTITAVAGLLAATTPVLFIHSRLLLEHLYPVPFVLAWLIFVKKFIDTDRPIFAFLSTLSLGIGFFTYFAAEVMMPLYFTATIVVLAPHIKKRGRTYAALLLGFTLPLATLIPWLINHPETLLTQVSYLGETAISPTTKSVFLKIIQELQARSEQLLPAYLSYFEPNLLFTTGEKSLIHSTGKVGVFLLPILPLLALGLMQISRSRKDTILKLASFGFITYPLAGFIIETHRISRALVVIPFVILLATYGAVFLLKSPRKISQIFLGFLIATSLLQFSFFLNDYFTEYRIRSQDSFGANIGGALESALLAVKTNQAQALYIDHRFSSTTGPAFNFYLDFYQLKTGVNAQSMQQLFDTAGQDASKLSANSIVVTHADQFFEQSDNQQVFKKIDVLHGPDGKEKFYLYYRSP